MVDVAGPVRAGRRSWLARVLVVALVGAGLVGCYNDSSALERSEPVVLTGASLPAVLGRAPSSIVAFAHSRPGGVPTWTQIPVQVDERKVVPFGSPSAAAGVTGTVYGSGAGPVALQYADPDTFVGPDVDPTFDLNDELVFMSSDAGGTPRAGEATEPPGVVPGSGVRVELTDPLGDPKRGWVYLFTSDGTLHPGAGIDLVDYSFQLTSGSYKATYKRNAGPNPETSTVTTDSYRISFSDRWIEDVWRIDAGSATGVDILDGAKSQFALSSCQRSNATFRDGPGAFAANIDGPVRAIRSFIGANSGPYTQRTQFFYRDRAVTVTDLRVHAIPAIMDFVDLSAAAMGMTYASSEVPSGVPIDGVADAVGTAIPSWQVINGPQGAVQSTERFASTMLAPGQSLDDLADAFYRDATNSPNQCWGDAHFIGAHGTWITTSIPNTDPAFPPAAPLQLTRTHRYSAPFETTAAAAQATATWAAQTQAPLSVKVAPYTPAPPPEPAEPPAP